eukprot:TRINITY_DN24_c0_g1_i2.p1 TRINITY_DN24_c0_g1~~TRINITY_DN24_c0_g1_i2.p1  ORF type:complete len:285 (-),score=76.77 TRINITY_DN24_c0_g1_i2:322-1155(-)
MVRFSVCLSALFAVASAAPSGYGPTAYVGAPSVHEFVVPGPAHVQKIPISGVVGHETVQVGSKQVLAGHQYVHGGTTFEQPPPYSYPAGPPKSSAQTIPVAPPAIPAPTQTFSAPAIAGSVQTYRNDNAAGRPNIVITPQQTIVKPVVEVQEVPYDVPVHVPVPVEREVILTKVVAKPVPFEVPVQVPVAKPYKVHPVHTVVKTPIVHQQTVSHSYGHGYAGAYPAGAYAAGAYPAAGYAHAGAYPAAGYAHAGAYPAAGYAHAGTYPAAPVAGHAY